MSIDKRPNGQYRARWREADGKQRAKHFDRKIDAERFLVKVKHDQFSGTYVDPQLGQMPLSRYAEQWLERMRPTWRTSTIDGVERSIRLRIIPTLGSRSLSSIRRSDIEAWAAGLGVAPGTVATARQHLGQILNAAVDDGLIPRNPAIGARLPRSEERRAQPLTLEQLDAISAAAPSWFRIAVVLGAGLGLRQAEATGLTLDRIDFLRRIVRVDRQLVSPQKGSPALAPPKTPSSYRTVPLPVFAADAISAHIAQHDTGREGLVLHLVNGQPISRSRFTREWRATCAAARVPSTVRYHDLRHTFASTLLSSGVSVKAVADWLGHASPTITLDTYAHLMPVDEDRARMVLDRAFAERSEDQVRTVGGQ